MLLQHVWEESKLMFNILLCSRKTKLLSTHKLALIVVGCRENVNIDCSFWFGENSEFYKKYATTFTKEETELKCNYPRSEYTGAA